MDRGLVGSTPVEQLWSGLGGDAIWSHYGHGVYTLVMMLSGSRAKTALIEHVVKALADFHEQNPRLVITSHSLLDSSRIPQGDEVTVTATYSVIVAERPTAGR